MFDTKSLCLRLVDRSEVATVLSTTGLYDARYLAANSAYLALVERIWEELDGQSLVGKGSARSDGDRDRRLWLLDRHGFYDCEEAVIDTASGRQVAVEISAQRIRCSGLSCDLEFLRPIGRYLEATGAAGMSGTVSNPRASFLPELQTNLERLSDFNRTILLRRMLTAVAEGGMLIAKVNQNPTIERYSDALRSRMARYVAAGRPGYETKFDFSALDAAAAEQYLLEMAGEIWSLIHFAKDPETAGMLERLVAPYTQPASLVVGDPGS